MCTAEGKVTEATVVDHKVKHEGDQGLMWDQTNWQPLCKRHHDSDKQMAEKSGDERARFDAKGRVVW
uniref:Putative endonuclease n=1 Tax=Variovorax sp. HH01 TaxID=1084736 RepID=I3PCQ5_9BURK|nr:putative endonuclease [Variovorax sp. HH01]